MLAWPTEHGRIQVKYLTSHLAHPTHPSLCIWLDKLGYWSATQLFKFHDSFEFKESHQSLSKTLQQISQAIHNQKKNAMGGMNFAHFFVCRSIKSSSLSFWNLRCLFIPSPPPSPQVLVNLHRDVESTKKKLPVSTNFEKYKEVRNFYFDLNKNACVLVMQAEGQKFVFIQWRKIFELFLYYGTKKVYLSLSSSKRSIKWVLSR